MATEEIVINVDADKYLTGRTYEEKDLLYKATNGVRHTVFVTRKMNLGNYNMLDIGMTISVPLGLTEEEVSLWNDLTKEAIQRGLDVVNDEMEKRIKRIEAQIKGS